MGSPSRWGNACKGADYRLLPELFSGLFLSPLADVHWVAVVGSVPTPPSAVAAQPNGQALARVWQNGRERATSPCNGREGKGCKSGRRAWAKRNKEIKGKEKRKYGIETAIARGCESATATWHTPIASQQMADRRRAGLLREGKKKKGAAGVLPSLSGNPPAASQARAIRPAEGGAGEAKEPLAVRLAVLSLLSRTGGFALARLAGLCACPPVLCVPLCRSVANERRRVWC